MTNIPKDVLVNKIKPFLTNQEKINCTKVCKWFYNGFRGWVDDDVVILRNRGYLPKQCPTIVINQYTAEGLRCMNYICVESIINLRYELCMGKQQVTVLPPRLQCLHISIISSGHLQHLINRRQARNRLRHVIVEQLISLSYTLDISKTKIETFIVAKCPRSVIIRARRNQRAIILSRG